MGQIALECSEAVLRVDMEFQCAVTAMLSFYYNVHELL